MTVRGTYGTYGSYGSLRLIRQRRISVSVKYVFDPAKDKVNGRSIAFPSHRLRSCSRGRIRPWLMIVLTTARFARWLSASSMTVFLCAFTPTGKRSDG